MSVVVLEDTKLLVNINSTGVNDLSSEQRCTVTEIKRENICIKQSGP